MQSNQANRYTVVFARKQDSMNSVTSRKTINKETPIDIVFARKQDSMGGRWNMPPRRKRSSLAQLTNSTYHSNNSSNSPVGRSIQFLLVPSPPCSSFCVLIKKKSDDSTTSRPYLWKPSSFSRTFVRMGVLSVYQL